MEEKMKENTEKNVLDFDRDMELDLRKVIQAIFKKKVWIICAAILGVVLSIGYAKFRKSPTYQANFTAYIYVNVSDDQYNIDSAADTTLKVNTAAELMKSGEVIQVAIDKAGLDLQAADVIRRTYITTTLRGTTQLIEVSISLPSEESTGKFATALAEVAPKKIGEITKGAASVQVVTSPDKVYTTPVSLRSYGLKGFVAGFAIMLFIVIAQTLFDQRYPEK